MRNPYELPYNYDSLEPYIDTKTVALHYNNHYMKYFNELKRLLKEVPELENVTYIDLAKHLDLVPLTIRDKVAFNLGGVLNHELYFSNIGPNKPREPMGPLKEAIDNTYGNFDKFKEEFIRNASLLVGSGYTFLVVNTNHELQIVNMSNQDTPYFYNMTPIMTIDLWEHAYYLNYQSNRDLYIRNFFQIVNFDEIEKNYEKAI